MAVARTFAVLFIASFARAQTVNPHAADPQAAETGRWTFRILCAPCHGINAGGGRGPDLTIAVDHTDREIYTVIARGVPGSEMSGYEERIDADGIWRLVSYIRSVAQKSTASIPGNASAGEKLFRGKGGCGNCHRVGADGSGIGPDLTRIGRLRSVAYLRASILKPDADVTPRFGTIRVTLRDGKSIVGVERNLDNFSAQLVDLSGKYHSFLREDVASITREPRSLMPSYEKLLAQAEVDDLVAYLISLRGDR